MMLVVAMYADFMVPHDSVWRYIHIATYFSIEIASRAKVKGQKAATHFCLRSFRLKT